MFFYLTLIETEEEKRTFVYLYENYKQTMYYTAYQILHNAHAAEDVVHQAFLRVLDRFDQVDVDNEPKIRGFLVTITQHIAIDSYRRQKREHPAYGEEQIELPMQDQTEAYTDTELIVQTILHLPQADSIVLRLKYVHGYQDSEIAQLSGISEAAVRKRISRAKKRLADRLEAEGVFL